MQYAPKIEPEGFLENIAKAGVSGAGFFLCTVNGFFSKAAFPGDAAL